MEREYKCDVYDLYKISIPVVITIITLVGALYTLNKTYFSSRICGSILIALFVFLILFAKKLRAFATRRIVLLFTDEALHITEYHIKKDAVLCDYSLRWDQINFYRYYHTKDDVNHIVLSWDNGKRKDFGFQDNKDIDETLTKDGIVGIFHAFIKAYNSNSKQHKIDLQKGFLNTTIGNYIVAFVGVFAAVGISLHIFFYPKTSFVSLLMGLMFYIGVLVSRKNNDRMYKQICELDGK